MEVKIFSPMPGTICGVSVSPRDGVIEGQELLQLEAMKMENPIVSTSNGMVKEIHVKEGDQVATKQLLVIIEES